MILAYPLRLLCLCLAAFFLVHLVMGLIVLAITPRAARMAERMTPRSASRWLLYLRLFPLACSLFVVAALCVPSYLWLEPEATPEEVGFVCFGAALLGAVVCSVSTARGIRAALRSLRYADRCERFGLKTELPGNSAPVWVTEGAAGSLALTGILHPRIFISREVLSALSATQLTAALDHEGAHQISRDNLKRLLILLAPDVLPFFRGFETLERHWAKFKEWAADDRAVAGDAGRALALAGALVRVARLGNAQCASPVISLLCNDGGDLAARVDRLLCMASTRDTPERPLRIVVCSMVLGLAAVMMLLFRPATFYSVHSILERLIA